MAVAKDKDELEEIGADNEAKKIKNELRFFRSVKPFLRNINNDFEQEYIASGQVVDAQEKVLTFSNNEKKHIIEIAKKIYTRIRKSTNPQIIPISQQNVAYFYYVQSAPLLVYRHCPFLLMVYSRILRNNFVNSTNYF